MPRETIRSLLLIDQDAGQRRLVSAIAARAGWRTVVADSSIAALRVLKSPQGVTVDAVLIDQHDDMPGIVADLRDAHPDKAVYVMTPLEDLAGAVEAMRQGATDYLVKPVAPERLMAALDTAANRGSIEGELRPMAEKLWQPLSFEEIVGTVSSFRAALATAERAAASRVPVLIEGERGTGKEMFAEAVHAASPRAQRPLIVVDCGVVPSNVVDSTLFGHEQGAFAGAFERKLGRFVEADGGTLFLDDVAALPLETQARLLAVLGPTPVSVDVLVRTLDLPARQVRGLLLQIEMDGRLRRYGGDLVSSA